MNHAAFVTELQSGEQRLHDPHRLAGREALILVE